MPCIDTAQLSLCYERLGDPDRPAVLLIMGFCMQLTAWPHHFWGPLLDAGFQVIRFDNRDMGLSGRMRSLGRPDVRRLAVRRALGLSIAPPYSIAEMAEDARQLLDLLEIDRAHVVGASMGGMIAQHLACAHPDRVASLCSMMSTTGQYRYAFPRGSVIRLVMAPVEPGLEARIEYGVRFWQTVASPADPPSREEIIEDIRAAWRRSGDLSGRDRQLAAIIAERSRIPMLRRLQVPALVLHGEADPLIRPAAGVATARAIPGARLAIIRGMGHDLRPKLTPTLTRHILAHAKDAC